MKVVAKALLVDRGGNLLVLRRGNTHPYFAGHLDFPGGEVEDGEEWQVAVAREICEETGCVVHPEALTKQFEVRHPDVAHVLHRIELDSLKPEISLSWEHDKYLWMQPDELLSTPLPDGVDKYFVDVISFLKKHQGTLPQAT